MSISWCEKYEKKPCLSSFFLLVHWKGFVLRECLFYLADEEAPNLLNSEANLTSKVYTKKLLLLIIMPKLNLSFNKVCSFYFPRNDHFLPRLLKDLLRNLLVLKMVSRSLYISGKLPYPSPKLILTLTIYLGQNVGLGEG